MRIVAASIDNLFCMYMYMYNTTNTSQPRYFTFVGLRGVKGLVANLYLFYHHRHMYCICTV